MIASSSFFIDLCTAISFNDSRKEKNIKLVKGRVRLGHNFLLLKVRMGPVSDWTWADALQA